MDEVREAMDRQAKRWTDILDNEEVDDGGFPIYAEEVKQRIFARLREWLKERKRLFPDEKPTEGKNVTDMRAWMNDPENARQIAKTMSSLGFVQSKGVRGGKKGAAGSSADAEQKKVSEGSALHALVFPDQANGEGDVDE